MQSVISLVGVRLGNIELGIDQALGQLKPLLHPLPILENALHVDDCVIVP